MTSPRAVGPRSGWRTKGRPGGSSRAGFRAPSVRWAGQRTKPRWNGSIWPGSMVSFVRWSGTRTGESNANER